MGDVLRLERTRIEPDMAATYRQIGIYSWGKGVIENPPISGTQLSKVTYYRFPPDALLLSNIQAWEAAIAVSTTAQSRDFIASQRFLPYVPVNPDEVDVRYLLQFFLSDAGMELIQKASPGTIIRNRTLGMRSFEDLEIPLPELEEQLIGVSRIAALQAVTDRSWAANRLSKVVPAGISNSVLEAGAGETRVALGDLFALQRRHVEVDLASSYHEIGVRSFGKGLFLKPPVSGLELGGKKVFRIAPGDLVVSNIFAWEGAVAVAREEHGDRVGSHRFMTWAPVREEVDVEYVYFYLASEMGTAKLAAASPGSAGRNRTLSVRAFSELEIPFPNANDQRRVVALMARSVAAAKIAARRSTLAEALPRAARNELFARR